LRSLIHRQRASYNKVLSSLDTEDADAKIQLELLQVETCVAHFVHLLAYHPALKSDEALQASADAGPFVSLKELVKSDSESPLKAWASSVGRHGLLKAMTDQIDFLLKALFEGQQDLKNAELISAILRTIHEVRCCVRWHARLNCLC